MGSNQSPGLDCPLKGPSHWPGLCSHCQDLRPGRFLVRRCSCGCPVLSTAPLTAGRTLLGPLLDSEGAPQHLWNRVGTPPQQHLGPLLPPRIPPKLQGGSQTPHMTPLKETCCWRTCSDSLHFQGSSPGMLLLLFSLRRADANGSASVSRSELSCTLFHSKARCTAPLLRCGAHRGGALIWSGLDPAPQLSRYLTLVRS